MIFKNLHKYFFHKEPSKQSPSFMIVGAQKAGTTALFNYLSQHTKILPTETKELHFFHCDIALRNTVKEATAFAIQTSVQTERAGVSIRLGGVIFYPLRISENIKSIPE